MTQKQPSEQRVTVNAVELAYFEWNSEQRGRGPTLLFAHATGFHARCWDPVIAELGEAHMIAVDQRSHGRSQNTPIADWSCFGRDLTAFVDALELTRTVGIGHSMGGHAMVDACAARPTRFDELILIDPVIAAPDSYGGGGWTIEPPPGGSHPTARRKRRFASPEEMIERFRAREPYRVFRPDALEAYCRYGLLPSADGEGYELACPPEHEASIYMTSRTNGAIHASVRAIGQPILLLRAKLPPPERSLMDFSSSPTWPELASAFRNARDLHLSTNTHYLPMEIPTRIAELISAALESRGTRSEGG